MSNYGKGSRILQRGILESTEEANDRTTNKALCPQLQMTVMMKCIHTANHLSEQPLWS